MRAVSVLATPTRGFRMMCVAVVLLMLRFLVEIVIAVRLFRAGMFDDLTWAFRWMARSQLIVMAAAALFVVGVASNLPELRRRRWSTTTALVALAAFAVTFLVHAWAYGLLSEVADGDVLGRLDDADRIPTRMFLATVTLVVGLFATVRVVRAYAMTDSNLALREQARNIGGMLILLIIADTFYRYSYGLGGGSGPGAAVFGPVAFAAGVGLIAFWLWCYRQLGALFVSIIYYLRVAQDVPLVDVVTPAARVATSKPAIAPPPPSKPAIIVAPIEPTASVAPSQDAPTPIEDGPRLLG